MEKNSLRVTSPDSIKGTHDSAIGNFGIPQYGGSMAGVVVYPKDNKKGCKVFDEFGISFKAKPGALPTFVVLDRGGTLFPVLSNLVLIVRFEVQFVIGWYSFGDLYQCVFFKLFLVCCSETLLIVLVNMLVTVIEIIW